MATTTTADDITVVLSGGTTNINPNLSLGGLPSATPIATATLNNLFDDVTSDETDEGHEDYRCIYFFNDGDTTVYDVEVWISDDFDEGATMEIGVEYHDESQRLTLSDGPVTGGYIRLSYDDIEFNSNYNSSLSDWAETLETSLNGLGVLQDVSITAAFVNVDSPQDTIIFDINFISKDGKRNHPTIEVVDNQLLPAGSHTVETPQQGFPVNTIASEIGFETTPPGGVGFFAATEISPVTFPYLATGEGFPLWIKRVTPEGVAPKERDGFELRFSAQTLEPV